ncbi:ubiquinol oxidase subunit II [Dyella sedimenti]|uniref:ubiquinol oxidase subunit II n=1 Tax=Dyella sedimenti TaxID=2919947 RepID=UPI001FAAD101|nr:ubiquinol oxidase subunit II [Dyella sedimenti]
MSDFLARHVRKAMQGIADPMRPRLGGLARLLSLGSTSLLAGCHLALFDPKGDIGMQERHLIVLSLGIMLAVVIPVIVLTLFFFWRYRATNTKATYAPEWAHSTRIEVVVWTIPCVIVAFLAVLIWRSTHSLDPYRPLASDVPSVRVQVVALNWKWLFIYPDYGIATVNELVIPARTPIDFELTADSIMNSFFIPRLGSQVYAMAGMQTQLHLVADQPGTYLGQSSAYSGSGFSDMHFQARAIGDADFRQWIEQAKASPLKLSRDAYRSLAEPSHGYEPTEYAAVDPGLFQTVLNQYMPAPKDGQFCGPALPGLRAQASWATAKPVNE